MFVYSRETPPEWQALLQEWFPLLDRAPYLWLSWLPGETYEPVQRWAIWEIVPPGSFSPLIVKEKWVNQGNESITQDLLAELNGPNPRDIGHWQETPYVAGGWRWVSESLVDLKQWQLYRETGGIPKLYWIIQGDRGGHKRALSPPELRILRANGHLNANVPPPGDWPYSPFDRRCLECLMVRDRLRTTQDWLRRTANHQQAVATVGAERQETRIESMKVLDKWLVEQIQEPADMLAHAVSVSQMPRGDGYYNRDTEKHERAFIESA